MYSEVANYDLIGTAASPATLTSSFAGNVSNAEIALHFRKLALEVTYTPAETGATYAQILLEYSNEPLSAVNGSTGDTALSRWRPFATAVPGTTQVDVYAQGGDQMGTTSGTPINVPTSGSSTSGQAVTVHFAPDTDLNATWIRVRVKEKFTTTAGTIYVGVSLRG